MTRWIVAMALLGCAESNPPAEASETMRAPDETAQDEIDEGALDEAPDEEPEGDLGEPAIPLDEMDGPALEAACFAGQNAACDRLGH